MASISKRKSGSYRVQYYNPVTHKKESINIPFTRNDSETRYLAKTKALEIEHKIALHKAGLQKFVGYVGDRGITLGKFVDIMENDHRRKQSVSIDTHLNEIKSLKDFAKVVGVHFPLGHLANDPEATEYYKETKLKSIMEKHRNKGVEPDENKIKSGINARISHIIAAFNYAVRAGHIPENCVPKFKKYKVMKRRIVVLEPDELMRMQQHLEGDALLAFIIIKNTAARRISICRVDRYDKKNGLKWKDINWMQNTITLRAKGKEYVLPMTNELREALLNKYRSQSHIDLDTHVIKYTRGTLSVKFRKAKREAGITKPGAAHILRHTAATLLLEAGVNVAELRDWLNHSSISITDIYTHVRDERLRKVANIIDRMA